MNNLHWSLQKRSHLHDIAQPDEVKNIKDTYSVLLHVYCMLEKVKLVQHLQNALYSELNVFLIAALILLHPILYLIWVPATAKV